MNTSVCADTDMDPLTAFELLDAQIEKEYFDNRYPTAKEASTQRTATGANYASSFMLVKKRMPSRFRRMLSSLTNCTCNFTSVDIRRSVCLLAWERRSFVSASSRVFLLDWRGQKEVNTEQGLANV